MKRTLTIILCALVTCAACIAGNRKPVIGITCGGSYDISSTSNDYIHCIEKAGGVAVILPCSNNEDALREIVKKLDGVLFTGGEDVNPAIYGEENHPRLGAVNKFRDTSDIAIAKAAFEFHKPVMGICRGSQFVNVFCGGTLYQDLPSQKGVVHTHGAAPSHKAVVDRNSILYETMKSDTLFVNSTHHQAVKQIGKGLRVTAMSTDGIVEAYQSTDKKQVVVGIQFHPEAMAPSDDTWYEVFKWFVKQAKKK